MIALGVLPAGVSAQAGHGGWESDERAAVLAAYRGMLDALRERDTTALRRLLTPDYVFTRGTTAQVTGLQERLRAVASDTEDVTTVMAIDECRTHVYGYAAVAACRVRERGVYRGRPFGGTVASTVTLVRAAAGQPWKIAATHTSAAPGYQMP
jgi:ketosteroid isomerase-like protein